MTPPETSSTPAPFPRAPDPFEQLKTMLANEASDNRLNEVVLSGAAGTGKTTVIQRVLEWWNTLGTLQAPYESFCLAPTGRAARRITEVTGAGAKTLHSAVYGAPQEMPDGELVWVPAEPFGGPRCLVVVDEASMVGHELANDLREQLMPGTTVLWVGDGNQLPPVNDFPGVNLLEPHVQLTTVWRSSSGIMKLANEVLACKTPEKLSKLIQSACNETYPGVHRNPAGWDPVQWRAESIKRNGNSVLLCFKNDMRHDLNMRTRKVLGYSDDRLVDGEAVVVMTNQRNLGIVNGDLGKVGEVGWDSDAPEHLERRRLVLPDRALWVYVDNAGFVQDTREWREMRREDSTAWRYRIGATKKHKGAGGAALKNPRWIRQMQETDLSDPSVLLGPAGETAHLHFGYCLTVHKSQGSEWDAVGIVWYDCWWYLKKDLEAAKSWWYTALTRARNGVILWW